MHYSLKRLLTICSFLILISCSPSYYEGLPNSEPLVIVTNSFDESISFIHGSEHELLTTWNLDHPVSGTLLLDQNNLLTYSSIHSKLYLYDLHSGKEVQSFSVSSGVDDLLLLNNKLYLTQREDNELVILSLKGEILDRVKVGYSPQYLYHHENALYVLNYEDTTISVIDLTTNQVTTTLPSIDRATDMLIVNDSLAWIGGHGRGADITNHIEIVDLNRQEKTGQLFAPTMPVAFLKQDNSILVLSHGSNQLREINAETNEIEAIVDTVANPFTMAALDDFLFVAGYDSNSVEIVDLNTLTSQKRINVGEGPLDLTIREEVN
ncbi:YncE family protein [Alkalihalophilus sp. As8PL]|uniref:YncE family protein n=1 Tax=Alkalihalophilus sp. As8PL TaxID=3237103 RepID=A0AB39BUE0_9BACI